MSNLSVRLPEDIESGLDREAELSGRNRSDLVREAVGEYLARKQRERLIEEMERAARAVYADSEVVAEARQIQQDFDAIDDSVKWVEAEERATGADAGDKWWE